MSQADLGTLQVKLTYAGNQTVGTRSVAITATGHTANIALFTPFQRPSVNYVNDGAPPLAFSTSTQQLKGLIDSIGFCPEVG